MNKQILYSNPEELELLKINHQLQVGIYP